MNRKSNRFQDELQKKNEKQKIIWDDFFHRIEEKCSQNSSNPSYGWDEDSLTDLLTKTIEVIHNYQENLDEIIQTIDNRSGSLRKLFLQTEKSKLFDGEDVYEQRKKVLKAEMMKLRESISIRELTVITIIITKPNTTVNYKIEVELKSKLRFLLKKMIDSTNQKEFEKRKQKVQQIWHKLLNDVSEEDLIVYSIGVVTEIAKTKKIYG